VKQLSYGLKLSEEYNLYCQIHKSKRIDLSGTIWDYIVAGQGKETIFIIPGGTGRTKDIFQYVLALEKNYRIIAVELPTNIFTIEDAINGVIEILNAESIDKVHFIGFDAGSMIEQQFVQNYPEKALDIVLIHTVVPNKWTAKWIGKYVRIHNFLPSFLYSNISKYFFTKWMQKYLDASQEVQNFWINHYADSFSKETENNRVRIIMDYLKNYDIAPGGPDNWSGKMLIIESEKDKISGKEEIRKQIRETYPHAEYFTFSDGDQITNEIFKAEKIISLIKNFLKVV
jgi:pimeloyl-ACP methyl ester carboxylesterase